MKLVTVALFITYFALSTATEICSEEILKECVSIKKCPSVWNKVEELYHPDEKNPVIGFLRYVKYNYYCDCYANEKEPAIDCPAKLPEGFKQVISKKRKSKQLLTSKIQKNKELHKICGYQLSNKMLTNGNRTDPTDYPWLALLQFEHSLTGERKFLCGGVLISDRHVLTAAHCVTSPSNKLVSVRLGEYDTTTGADCADGDGGKICKEPAQDIEVAECVVHEDYDDGVSPRFDESEEPSDLAIVRLKTSARLGDVRPICLPQSAEPASRRYEVAGWSTSMAPNAKSLPRKLYSTVYGISPEECESYPITQEYSSGDHICAGGRWGQVCIADAGGPLMAWEIKEDRVPRMTVFGVGFMEMPCAYATNRPGVFTQVHKYVPWIEEHIY